MEGVRELPGFPGCHVTDEGRVIGLRGRELVARRGRGGHAWVMLVDGGGRERREYVDELVALAFLPAPVDPASMLSHRDGDASNCRAGNLEWVEVQVESPKPFDRGPAPVQGPPAARDVEGIVRACLEGRVQREVAAEHGVSQSMVSRIALAAGVRRRRPLSAEQVERARAMMAEGRRWREIAEAVGCTWHAAYMAVHGRRRKGAGG